MDEFKELKTPSKTGLISQMPVENKIRNDVPTEIEAISYLRRSVTPYFEGPVDDKHKKFYELFEGKIGRNLTKNILGPNAEGVLIAFNTNQVSQSGNDTSSYLEQYFKQKLPDAFPESKEIEARLGQDLQFFIWVRKDDQPVFLIKDSSGQKFVLRTTVSDRSLENINKDASKRPDIIPPFKAFQFQNGKIGLLINFIEGHKPITDEERQLCMDSSQKLLDIPMREYDLSDLNFLINNVTGKPYYVDRDVVETIAKNGLSPDNAQSREGLLEEGKKRINPFSL